MVESILAGIKGECIQAAQIILEEAQRSYHTAVGATETRLKWTAWVAIWNDILVTFK